MLQELELLTTRIQRLVGRLKTVTDESLRLSEELARVKAERDDLSSQVNAHAQEVVALKLSLGLAEASASKTRAQATDEKATLQGTLDLFRQENEAIQSALKTREGEVKHLRDINEQAKRRIEGVLERLPGAISEESN
jgi:predicted  nucleic acid-binding Zn-ribbon protein